MRHPGPAADILASTPIYQPLSEEMLMPISWKWARLADTFLSRQRRRKGCIIRPQLAKQQLRSARFDAYDMYHKQRQAQGFHLMSTIHSHLSSFG
ncbi:hypothetical protein BDZ45DRAFT_363672 [Acephala macrosclerotiorum]|nr:hypothetical protein BDZ45DRAFT_363672 [Acephala macrosclerotiorum]